MNENCDGFSDRKFYTEIVHFFRISKINLFFDILKNKYNIRTHESELERNMICCFIGSQ